MKMLQMVAEAEKSRKSLKKHIERIEKRKDQLEKLNVLEDQEYDLLEYELSNLRFYMRNLQDQINFINLKYRHEIIPDSVLDMARLTCIQKEVFCKRFTDGLNFSDIEQQMGICNASDAFAKAIRKILRAIKEYAYAIDLGLDHENARKYAMLSQRERQIFIFQQKGMKQIEIAATLDVSKAYVSKTLKKIN